MKVVKWYAAILVLGVGFVLAVRFFPTLPSSSLSVSEAVGDQTQHIYPTPAYWPASPYPMGGGGQPQAPQPQVTVLPCPPGEVPTTAQWHGQTVAACTIPGGVPANPGAPLCAGVNGGPPYAPIKEPDGFYDCGQDST